jgi:membrane associated rhomboid family serine protease
VKLIGRHIARSFGTADDCQESNRFQLKKSITTTLHFCGPAIATIIAHVLCGEIALHSIRQVPITAELLIVCAAIHVSCLLQEPVNRSHFREIQREWGAIQTRVWSDPHRVIHRSQATELHGPFDVWNGEWWRIPITSLHHDHLLGLVLSLGAAWYLGSRLERHWGSFSMAVFLLPAATIPIMGELCIGRAITGLSSICCAMLGALMVLRHIDPDVTKEFTEDGADISLAIVVMGWIATVCDLASFPLVAHWIGLGYGALVAWVTSRPGRRGILLRVSTALIHLWLIPATFLVCHPIWIGRYYWYQATVARNPQRAEKNLERATDQDPALTGAWLMWSELAEVRADRVKAFSLLLDGLAANPASEPLIANARRLWRHLDRRERDFAEAMLSQRFGDRSDIWLNNLRTSISSESTDARTNSGNAWEYDDVSQFRLDQELNLPRIEQFPDRLNRHKPQGQGDENDAVEGETL